MLAPDNMVVQDQPRFSWSNDFHQHDWQHDAQETAFSSCNTDSHDICQDAHPRDQ